jgi:hypothetical protein
MIITTGQKIQEYIDYAGYSSEQMQDVTGLNEKEFALFLQRDDISLEELNVFSQLFQVFPEEFTNGKSLEDFTKSELHTAVVNHDKIPFLKFKNYLKATQAFKSAQKDN